MYLSSIKLFQFRNVKEEELTFSPGVNLIHGRNGQGKTNIIEAIHILSATKSFRTTKARELSAWGSSETGIHGTVKSEYDQQTLGVIIEKGKKQFLVDGKEISAVQFVGRLLCVTFSPNDIELIKGAPQLRRQFLDKHCVDLSPGLLQYIMHYNRALKSKLHILKSGTATNQSLDAWDRVLADAARMIIKARRQFINDLQSVLQSTYNQFASVDGEVKIELKESFEGEDVQSENIYQQFVLARSKDIATSSVSVGPHKDDFEVTINQRSSRNFASQGQSKSLALALKLSALKLLEHARGQRAIFLLDDVDSELDEERLKKLYRMIQQGERQVLITGTEPRLSYFEGGIEYNTYRVENGHFYR